MEGISGSPPGPCTTALRRDRGRSRAAKPMSHHRAAPPAPHCHTRLAVSPEREGSPPPDPDRAGHPLADDWQPSWGEGSVELATPDAAAPDFERGSPSEAALTAAAPDDNDPDDPGTECRSPSSDDHQFCTGGTLLRNVSVV